jgi:hypothetical protein
VGGRRPSPQQLSYFLFAYTLVVALLFLLGCALHVVVMRQQFQRAVKQGFPIIGA